MKFVLVASLCIFLATLTSSSPVSKVAYGESGLKYVFDGNEELVKPFIPIVKNLKDIVGQIVKVDYNFVLIHRFKNGHQYFEETKRVDDFLGEADLEAPLSIVLFGQSRELVLRRLNGPRKGRSEIVINHGNLIVMNSLGLKNLRHSFPQMKGVTNPTLILQFVKMC